MKIWSRRRRKGVEAAVAERIKSEKRAQESENLRKKFEEMGRTNHFANSIIEGVLEGYDRKDGE